MRELTAEVQSTPSPPVLQITVPGEKHTEVIYHMQKACWRTAKFFLSKKKIYFKCHCIPSAHRTPAEVTLRSLSRALVERSLGKSRHETRQRVSPQERQARCRQNTASTAASTATLRTPQSRRHQPLSPSSCNSAHLSSRGNSNYPQVCGISPERFWKSIPVIIFRMEHLAIRIN